jgi:hypothetical protein
MIPATTETIAMTQGTMVPATGFEDVASAARTPNAAKAIVAGSARLPDSKPTTAPRISPTNTIPIRRAGLSFVPKVEMAQSFSPGGAESTTQSATPWIRDGAPRAPANSSEMPKDTATDIAPYKAAPGR